MKVGDVAECNDQVIVCELELARAKPWADRYDLFVQIDGLDFAHDQVGARAQAPKRRDDIDQTNGPGNDLREHRLVDPIILAIDQGDGCLLGAQQLLQVARGVNPREAAPGIRTCFGSLGTAYR